MTATTLIDEIRAKYFSEEDILKDDLNISFHEVIDYEQKLIQIILQDGNNALTETLETFIEELKKGAN